MRPINSACYRDAIPRPACTSARLALLFVCLSLSTLPVGALSDYSAAYTFTTLAGYARTGSADGAGGAAQFWNPEGVAVDASGNIYVTDSFNCTIRKITSAGVVSTIAGFAGTRGSTDGTNAVARFNDPRGVAVDINGNLYVTDVTRSMANGSLIGCTIRKITQEGTNWVVDTIAGSSESYGSADGTNNAALFRYLYGITVDAAGSIYVADDSSIRKISPIGTNWVVSTIAGSPTHSGSANGTNDDARFNQPVGIAVDGFANLFVADWGNNAIRKITPVGTNWVVSTLAQVGTPYGIAVHSNGNIYVSDSHGELIQMVTQLGTNWVVSTLAGSGIPGSADGTGTNASFTTPAHLALDSVGNLYVADSGNSKIRKVTSAGVVSSLAGSAGGSGNANGTGTAARFNNPYGIVVDNAGNVYVADYWNHTIRQVTSAGVVSTIAGLAGSSGSGDGTGSYARFNFPTDVTLDDAGNLYVADCGNSKIRKITSAGVVSTLAGPAGFDGPFGVAVDHDGNVYVADAGYNTIQKITPAGVVSTVAGLAGNPGSVSGTNDAARFNYPTHLVVDTSTNLYVADSHNYTIRKITPRGTNWVVSTIVGSAGIGGSADGINDAVRFGYNFGYHDGPGGMALDTAGNLYVADVCNDTIRKIMPVGTNWVVSTIGGLARSAGSADGAGGSARFFLPEGVAVDASGNLYVADTLNHTIRKGVFTAYTATNALPYTRPPMDGQLMVTLVPPEANGQWRFPWELGWHNSGEAVSTLVQGNYPIEFRNVPGYLTIPQNLSAVQVTNGGTTFITTNVYYPTISANDTNSGSGSLTVYLGPTPPSGAGWRFLADNGSPFLRSGYTTNLAAGTYLIEFASASGRVKPLSQAVLVRAGLPTVISENYLLAQSPPAGVLLPGAVPTNNISDLTAYPFGFNGQLQTDVGYGSGVAVRENVVLTAAHLVFNDQTLSYVNQAYWYHQREASVFEPKPLQARGYCVLGGYAALRTNELQSGLVVPGQSTPQSRNLDVAALYFLSPVAGGGYGGYLPSDEAPNSWLSSTSLKMLVGYPVGGSLFGQNIVPGVMYQTDPQPYPLSLATDPVENQQVYTAPWLLSYPGNSGGPFYVQFNGYFYPAGVYLGTLYNGFQPYASLVRAIDSNVVAIITKAATQGDGGTNNTGGGVLTIIPNQWISADNPGYVQWQLNPPEAVRAGAGWRLQGDTAYSTATSYTRAIISTNPVTVEFRAIAGWNPPTNQTVKVVPGQLRSYAASYTAASGSQTGSVPPMKSLFSGLFSETNEVLHHSSGFLRMSTGRKGSFSGNLQLAGKVYRFSGAFGNDGAAYVHIARTPIALQLQLDSSGDILTGQVSNATWIAELVADRRPSRSRSSPAPEAGKYTLVIPGQGDSTGQPGGDGFGAVIVTWSGRMAFRGTLGDGTKVAQNAFLSQHGEWPFYVPLYSGKGSILGWLTFTNRANDHINGWVNWIKLSLSKSKFYSQGFTNQAQAVGSHYLFTKGARVLDFDTGQLRLSGGNLADNLTNWFELGTNNKGAGSNKLSLTIRTSSGLFNGSVLNPTTGKRISFKGAVLQNTNAGCGYFLGTDQTGRVFLGP